MKFCMTAVPRPNYQCWRYWRTCECNYIWRRKWLWPYCIILHPRNYGWWDGSKYFM